MPDKSAQRGLLDKLVGQGADTLGLVIEGPVEIADQLALLFNRGVADIEGSVHLGDTLLIHLKTGLSCLRLGFVSLRVLNSF